MGLQAKTVAEPMVRRWLTIFDAPAVICSDRRGQIVGSWFKSMCKHMGIRHPKTVAYHNRSNGPAGRREANIREVRPIAHQRATEESA